MTDPVPTPEHPTDEAYEAALVAHQSLGADVEWRDRTAFVVDAVWPLAFAAGVSEGRQQAAREIREVVDRKRVPKADSDANAYRRIEANILELMARRIAEGAQP